MTGRPAKCIASLAVILPTVAESAVCSATHVCSVLRDLKDATVLQYLPIDFAIESKQFKLSPHCKIPCFARTLTIASIPPYRQWWGALQVAGTSVQVG